MAVLSGSLQKFASARWARAQATGSHESRCVSGSRRSEPSHRQHSASSHFGARAAADHAWGSLLFGARRFSEIFGVFLIVFLR